MKTLPDGGLESVTLEIGPDEGDAYYLSALVLMESAYPGAVVAISVAEEYTGVSTTAWRDVYRRTTPEVGGGENNISTAVESAINRKRVVGKCS